MLQITKNIINYQDQNYSHAVNYSGSLYNYPMTLNYGDKHNRTKYILSSGTQDIVELWQEGIYIYVLGQNNELSYISLMEIDTEKKEVTGEVFLNENECTVEGNYCYGILDKESKEQIKIMCEYL
jgi:hypothetical protein